MKSIKEWRAEQNEVVAQSATPQQQIPQQQSAQQPGMPFKSSAVAGSGSRGKAGMGALFTALQTIAANNPNIGLKISNIIYNAIMKDPEISQQEKDAFNYSASSFNAAWQTGARGINARQG